MGTSRTVSRAHRPSDSGSKTADLFATADTPVA